MTNLKVDERDLQVGALGGRRGVPAARARVSVWPPVRRRLCRLLVPRSIRTSARGSAASRISRRRRWPTSSPSTSATTGPTTRPSSSPATSIRRSSTRGSTSTSARSRGRPSRCPGSTRASRRGPPIAASRSPDPQVPLPAVAFTWLAPPADSADAPALQVAAAVLAAGESSRLNQALVYRQRVATQAGFNADLRAGPGLLIAYAIAAGGKSTDGARQGAARRSHSPGEDAAERGRAGQGQDPAHHRGVQLAPDAARPRHRARRGGGAPRRPGTRQQRARRRCSASAPTTCSACCAATSSTRTRSRSTTARNRAAKR